MYINTYLHIHPKLDLVNFAVIPYPFCSLNRIYSKNVIGRNSSELKDINLKYSLSKYSLRYININLPLFCNFQLLFLKDQGKYPQNFPNIAKFH